MRFALALTFCFAGAVFAGTIQRLDSRPPKCYADCSCLRTPSVAAQCCDPAAGHLEPDVSTHSGKPPSPSLSEAWQLILRSSHHALGCLQMSRNRDAAGAEFRCLLPRGRRVAGVWPCYLPRVGHGMEAALGVAGGGTA